MGMSKSAPDVPDLNQTVGSQVGGNIGMTKFNNMGTLYGTSSPYGTTSWTKARNDAGNVQKATYTDPYTGERYKTPRWEQQIELSPEEQQKYDLSNQAQIGALGKANELMGGMGNFALDDFDFTKSLGEIGGSIYQPGSDLSGEAWGGSPLRLGNEATEARLFELGSKRLDPKFRQASDTLEASLTARGLRPGTAAWNAARNQFSEGENDAYNQLLLTGRGQAAAEGQAEWQSGLQGNAQRFGQLTAARELGMGEQGQQFQQATLNRGRELAERGQSTGEQFGERDRNIQYLTQLLQAGQPNMPQFTGSQPGASPYMDYAGAINENWDQQFKSWAQESANKGNMFGGAMSGLSGIIASDERIKDNIKQVGKTAEGLPIYEFSIGDGEMQTGVLAQDVEAVNPAAVVEGPGGLKGVDYPAAVGDGTGTYTVEKGDNIWDIGERLGVDPREIIAANPDIQNPDFIVPGQHLVVPGMAAPGPAAIPMSALPAAGAATGIPAVASALAAPAGPGMMPPGGGMPAAPMTEPVSAPPAVPAQVNTPEQAQAMEELIRLFPERFQRTPSGGMGAY